MKNDKLSAYVLVVSVLSLVVACSPPAFDESNKGDAPNVQRNMSGIPDVITEEDTALMEELGPVRWVLLIQPETASGRMAVEAVLEDQAKGDETLCILALGGEGESLGLAIPQGVHVLSYNSSPAMFPDLRELPALYEQGPAGTYQFVASGRKLIQPESN